jgi:hypothetical protein
MDYALPLLPSEIEAAVAAQLGGPVAVPSRQGDHVVMSMAAYLEMLGIDSDEEFRRSVADLRISLAQAESSETLSLDEVRQKLIEKYGA